MSRLPSTLNATNNRGKAGLGVIKLDLNNQPTDGNDEAKALHKPRSTIPTKQRQLALWGWGILTESPASLLPAYNEREKMRTDLVVAYTDKDEVKGLGAKWDAGRRTWYVENVANLEAFLKWIPSHLKKPTKSLPLKKPKKHVITANRGTKARYG